MAEHDIVFKLLLGLDVEKINKIRVITRMNNLLNSLKILDFSSLLPGPFATLYLADMGAEVLHIESPSRIDAVRHLMPMAENGQSKVFNYLHRNKQSIALDLKQQHSIELIYHKVKEIDILVEQFRPGVMQALGLDYTRLSQINPRLIYCSITGYGQTGPYKDKAGHDLNYMSLSGIAGHSGRQDSAPPMLGIQVADLAGGSLHAVIAILAAVIEREHSGLGQHLDISMTDCAMTLNSMAAIAALNGLAQKPEQTLLNGGSFYDYYATADGRYLSIAGLEPKFIQALLSLLERPELLAQLLSGKLEDRQASKQQIQAVIVTQTLAYWLTFFAQHDVCVEPVLTLAEALDSDLSKARQWVVDVPVERGSTEYELQLSCPIKFSRSKLRYDFSGQKLGQGKW